jgi:hypothetical protein
MDGVGLLAGSAAAGLVLFGSCLMAPGPEPRARTELQLARCEPGKDACPDGRPWIASHGLPPRISDGGYFYGECGGWISAVVLDPEPCDQRRQPIKEAALSPRP